jgi:hypothetical protein
MAGRPRNLIENVVHNFGFMFDASRDLIFFLGEEKRGKYIVPYDAGSAVGTIIWLALRQ